ncbi:MAG: Uma2 family endonuclease [Lachnospiraceae bacterium]|nr:Uma2 family endonuclease [Lachnospiraceae bacterium]
MTIEEMMHCKKQRGLSYRKMAELSGIPQGTIQKIFSGETKSPRYDTLQALEAIFQENKNCVAQVPTFYSAERSGEYTIADYRALPDEQRVELIDGVFYDMSAPTFRHQRIVGEIYRQISNYIIEQKGTCQPVMSPVDVQLDCDEKTMIQPDVAIICKLDRIQNWGVYGAPDFILEVLSPSTRRKDCVLKLGKYEAAGVREYWMIDPIQEKVITYFFEGEEYPTVYGFDQKVPLKFYDEKLVISFEYLV